MIHIDIDPAEIGKNVETFIPIVGDVKNVLEEANQIAEKITIRCMVRTNRSMERNVSTDIQDAENELKPQWVIEHLSETTKGEAIITTDVGQHQMWVAQYYQFVPSHHIILGWTWHNGLWFSCCDWSTVGLSRANSDRSCGRWWISDDIAKSLMR